MRKESILMPYHDSCISVNHYLGRNKKGGYYVKPETKDWTEELGWLLKKLHLEDWELPLEVTCSAWFKDGRSACDIANFSKIILDTIEDVTGINDKNMRWRDGTREIDKNNDPHLLIVISEPMSGYPPIAPQSTPDRVKSISSDNLPPKRKYAKKRHKTN